jgi:histidinol-phosphate phosphatase family protein
VLVAGGKATRMGALAAATPKPMLPFGGRPLLAHHVDLLERAGVGRVTILAGHAAEGIASRMGELARPGVRLELAVETRPRGSGGCLRGIPGPGGETLLVLFGDVLLDMDLAELLRFHRRHGGLATAVVHPNDHPQDSDLAELDPEGRILALHRKPHPPDLEARNLVTAGVFVVEPELVAQIPTDRPCDLVHDMLVPAVEGGVPVFGYRSTEYLKDIGTPERFRAVTVDWEGGRVAARHRSRRRPAAFLDRDGTLNRHVGLLTRPEEIELLPRAAEAVRRLNLAGVLTVVITNQPVIARGLCDERTLSRIHARLEMALGAEGAYLDALYHCPHHPDGGYPGEIPHLKRACSCRKPEIGMVEAAVRDLPVDLGRSALFGDTWRDVEAARRAGLPAYWIGGETSPGASAAGDLSAAVEDWLARSSAAATNS